MNPETLKTAADVAQLAAHEWDAMPPEQRATWKSRDEYLASRTKNLCGRFRIRLDASALVAASEQKEDE